MQPIVSLTKSEVDVLKKALKDFGVKYCSKKSFYLWVGRQTHTIVNGDSIINYLLENNYYIDNLDTVKQLLEKGLLDVILVAKYK